MPKKGIHVSNIVPQSKQRRYMLPFRSEDGEPFGLLTLNATTYEDAVKIARCVAGPSASKMLCFNDVVV